MPITKETQYHSKKQKVMLRKNKSRVWILGLIIIAVALATIAWKGKFTTHEFALTTITATKGDVSNTITATGTLEATNTVVVGTQVSGVIEKLYVDFNSIVKKGQLIAELDKSTLQSSLENAEADLERAEASYEYQASNLERNKVLYDKELLAKSAYDLVLFNYKTSKAEVKSAKANLSRSKRNLSYASIYSPIDGVVLNRAVEEGQTVAASMNTPELFTITNDLSTMQVEADIDEADIGQMELQQRVEFTVDAFSELTFNGEVSEMRLQPNESSNVITYIVIITVSNPELKLKPGMTASITAYVEEANDVLVVGGRATRFTPDHQVLDEYMRSINDDDAESVEMERRPEPQHRMPMAQDDTHKVVWVKKDNDIRPVVIEVGIDDGSNLEVISGLEEGAILVTSLALAEGSKQTKKDRTGDEGKSPFVQEGQKGPGGGQGGPPR